MPTNALKVGELARRTGLTVRTLHHYDQIGLLKPSLHTESGHRLYTAGDVARLQQVLSLRQLGFSLEQVRDCLDRPGFSPLEVLGLHLARLREQIESQRQLCQRLLLRSRSVHGADEPGRPRRADEPGSAPGRHAEAINDPARPRCIPHLGRANP